MVITLPQSDPDVNRTGFCIQIVSTLATMRASDITDPGSWHAGFAAPRPLARAHRSRGPLSYGSRRLAPVASACATSYASAEVKPVYLIDLERAKQRLRVDRPDRRERDHGAHHLRHPRAMDLVERPEHVHALRDDKIHKQQIGLGLERCRRTCRQLGRIAGQAANENVGVQERGRPSSE